MDTPASTQKTLFDFSTATSPAGWQTVNDDVMGGVSRSSLRLANGIAVFQGTVSLENDGGFASVRSLPARYDLAGCDAFLVRVRGDGRSYKFTARTASSFDRAVYQLAFRTKEGNWEDLCLPLKDFVPTFRGRVLSGEPPLDPEKISSVGFLISDKQVGTFRLEVAWIKAIKLPHAQ
jgi:monofunctional biosynthetic peptidoglycan transglycosylase